jgi:TRAP-type C4-dicarboxylate transport system permease small subunit
MNIGLTKETLKKNKEISNIFACLLFLGYNISLLFIGNHNTVIDKIVHFIIYYFLPIFFLLIIFIINIYIA